MTGPTQGSAALASGEAVEGREDLRALGRS
jgi:hypothetical protein